MSIRIYPMKFGINRCYLIRQEGVIMIDGGPPHKLKSFQKYLSEFPVNSDDIKLIILTHGDFDHVGSAMDIKSVTGAEIAIHEKDRENFEESIHNFPSGTNLWGHVVRFMLNPVTKLIFKFPGGRADIILDDSDFPLHDFGVAGQIIYTPGHTQGSVTVLLETGDAFVGCLAHNNLPFRFRPGLPIFGESIRQIKENWNGLIRRGAKMIYPAHGDPFPVDVIKNILNK